MAHTRHGRSDILTAGRAGRTTTRRASGFIACLLAVTAATAVADEARCRLPLPPGTEAGAVEFEARWGLTFSLAERWGLGPTSNGDSCASCHPGAGRGGADAAAGRVLHLARPPATPGEGPRADPNYGHRLQTQGIAGRVPAEGTLALHWEALPVTLADGTQRILRRPRVTVEELAFGAFGADTRWSLRQAPSLRGLGQLEQVRESALRGLERAQPAQGLDGRMNRVAGALAGRFGHKAGQAQLDDQVTLAFLEELGVTSERLPEQNCPDIQVACRAERIGQRPELAPARLAALLAYLRALPAPQPATLPARGAAAFSALGCAGCHQPQLPADTGPVAAYTDLLVHDLGPGLADDVAEFRADGARWRTAPLWGLGCASGDGGLLHDGRARDIEEAILWHGGEAAAAQEAYRQLPARDRRDLLDFLRAL